MNDGSQRNSNRDRKDESFSVLSPPIGRRGSQRGLPRQLG
jgi:hypothetical protein